MRNLIRKFQSYWLADASFVTLLVILIAAVFVLPVIMETSGHGVLLFNILLLSVFFSGIFSTRSVALISISAILFGVHLALRLIRFGENPYSFFVLENLLRKLPRQVDSSKLEFPRRSTARGNALAAGSPARRAA